MIREATQEDLYSLGEMLKEMTIELWPQYASYELGDYIIAMRKHLLSGRDRVFIDDKLRGFFVVRDETEEITPRRKVINGLRVYIRPEYRKGRLLKEFYDKLFEEYPDGEIWGLTEYGSEHNDVLLKRHKPVAIVYKLKRR